MKRILSCILLCILVSLQSDLWAEVRLHHIFADNMVLQRDKPIQIWGWADKGEVVKVSFLGQTLQTKADKQGKWKVQLKASPYGGPHTMSVSGKKNEISLKNILIGEVWLCSGQSNMEMPVNGWGKVYNYESEVKNASFDKIRSFNVEQDISTLPKEDFDGNWQVCSPSTVSDFSATAYFFARHLYQTLGIPIGIINSSWGGTDIETWISNDAFAELPTEFQDRYGELNKLNLENFTIENKRNEELYYQALKEDKGLADKWYSLSSEKYDSWTKMAVPQEWSQTELDKVDGIVWFTYQFELPSIPNQALLSLGMVDDDDVTWINGVKVGETQGYNVPRKYTIDKNILKKGVNRITVKVTDHSSGGGIYGDEQNLYLEADGKQYSLVGNWDYKISVANTDYNFIKFSPNMFHSLLYNAMINPITQLSMQGAIWYQGENNENDAYRYRTLFAGLINNWRNKWNYDFPFYWVQLANYKAKDKEPTDSNWAMLRESQTTTLSLTNTGQAVITDIGDGVDIHPRNKQDVGKRLANIALKRTYGHSNIVESGPTFKSMKKQDNKLVLEFDNVGSGLQVKSKYGYVEGFAIAGEDGKYKWAKASVEGTNKVVVYCDEVAHPSNIRFCWSDNPDINLFNSVGLPAAPFRTDK